MPLPSLYEIKEQKRLIQREKEMNKFFIKVIKKRNMKASKFRLYFITPNFYEFKG